MKTMEICKDFQSTKIVLIIIPYIGSFVKMLFARFPLQGLPDLHLDLEWFMRAREQRMPIVIQKETIAYYRRHGNIWTDSITSEEADSGLVQMLRESLDGRRKNNNGELEPLRVDTEQNEKSS